MASTIFISAGEASGEQYGALLATELRRRLGEVTIFGMGGPRMEQAGVERVVRSEDVAVMGLTEVVLHLPRIWREFQRLKRTIRERRPQVAVLIDFPEFHFRLAREFHRLGIPVIYFVSPQLWAWKAHRIRLVRRFVRRMAVIFPFEEPYYRQRGVEAVFVGHPLAELPPPAIGRDEFAATNGLDTARNWIGLLPGSRMKEIETNLPEMLKAARTLAGLAVETTGPAKRWPPVPRESDPTRNDNGRYVFVVPLASTLHPAQREEVRRIANAQGDGLELCLVDDARATLQHARASVVASGTATVEAALIGNPFVVVYRVSPLTYAIAKRVVKVTDVAMANLIAGRRVVPELIQHDFTAANIVQHLQRLLPEGPDRESMRRDLAAVRKVLRARPEGSSGQDEGAIERVAEMVAGELEADCPAAQTAVQR